MLAAGSLDGWLRFYTASGAPKHKEREFEGGVLSLAYFNNDFLLVSTTDKWGRGAGGGFMLVQLTDKPGREGGGGHRKDRWGRKGWGAAGFLCVWGWDGGGGAVHKRGEGDGWH